jgi:Tol biopolymer transport system component
MLITNAIPVGESWSLPIDPNRGTLSGLPRRITAEESSKQRPVISRNGARMAYVTGRSGPPVKVEMRTRSFPDSRETALPVRGSSPCLFPRFSEDGSTLAYQDLIEGQWQSSLVREGIMPGRKICDGCTVRAFFSSSNEAVVQYGAELVRQNLETGGRASILKVDSRRMADADLSPNDRWVVYVHILASGRYAIRVAPAAGAASSRRRLRRQTVSRRTLCRPRTPAASRRAGSRMRAR